jgi:hypothetical protein
MNASNRAPQGACNVPVSIGGRTFRALFIPHDGRAKRPPSDHWLYQFAVPSLGTSAAPLSSGGAAKP